MKQNWNRVEKHFKLWKAKRKKNKSNLKFRLEKHLDSNMHNENWIHNSLKFKIEFLKRRS